MEGDAIQRGYTVGVGPDVCNFSRSEPINGQDSHLISSVDDDAFGTARDNFQTKANDVNSLYTEEEEDGDDDDEEEEEKEEENEEEDEEEENSGTCLLYGTDTLYANIKRVGDSELMRTRLKSATVFTKARTNTDSQTIMSELLAAQLARSKTST